MTMTAIKYMHHTPGRLRLRGRHFHCHGERARKAITMLQAMRGVGLVKLNAHAGSLTVHYDPTVHSQTELLAVLDAAGCLHVSVHRTAVPRAEAAHENVAGLFGKALVGALAQRTATRLIGTLL
jgi:Heavy metal associated domain 2